MVNKGDVLVFADGTRCMVVENAIKQGGFNEKQEYKMWDDSKTILVNLGTGEVALHFRNGIPYEHGEPYVPIWGGVVRVEKRKL